MCQTSYTLVHIFLPPFAAVLPPFVPLLQDGQVLLVPSSQMITFAALLILSAYLHALHIRFYQIYPALQGLYGPPPYSGHILVF